MPRKITDAQRKAVYKYEAANYDKTLVRFKAGELATIRAAADAAGESLNQYTANAVRQRMEREQATTDSRQD